MSEINLETLNSPKSAKTCFVETQEENITKKVASNMENTKSKSNLAGVSLT